MANHKLIFVATVKHTGSHVLLDGVLDRRNLHKHGYQAKHGHPLPEPRFPPGAVMVLSAMRHPRRVALSWHRRRKLGQFMQQWQQFMDDYHPRVDHYVHVDDPRVRDRQVEAISIALGVWLRCRWDIPYASVHNTISVPLDACPEVPASFERFYELTKP